MCGIFGIVFDRELLLGPILVGAAKRLAYRGYDSVGCATISSSGEIDLRKDVGKVDEVARRLGLDEMRGVKGIAQLRWATFGAPSKVNAQPHLDSEGKMVGAHNGNVVNNIELREQFKQEGMIVRSTNDGESCVHAVERYRRRGHPMLEAVRLATKDLEGDYAFVIADSTDDKLYAVKKGSGLVVGLGDGFACVSSDLPSIIPLTRRIVRVSDGEMVELWAGGAAIYSLEDGARVEREEELYEGSVEVAEKAGYPHFMLKEIYEQPKVAGDLLHLLAASRHVHRFAEAIASARRVFLVGCGTSYNACLIGSVYLNRLAGIAAVPVLAPQLAPQFGRSLGPEDVGIFVSQSGETKDVIKAVEVAKRAGTKVLGLVNVLGSTLMAESDVYLPLACGYEIAVPATKTFSNQVLTFLYLASVVGGGGDGKEAVDESQGALASALEAMADPTEKLAAELAGHDDMYCLGYGLTLGAAMEGALKIKEVTYAHCEGMLSAEFKHGPLAAVTDSYPVIFVAAPEDVDVMVSAINEVTCRGGNAVVLGQDDSRLRRNATRFVEIPRCHPLLVPVVAVVGLQLLAYKMAVARGIDPDYPRNLSKTLTVD